MMDQKFYDYIDASCTRFFSSLDIQMSRNIETAGIQTRQSNSSGIWCCVLLPIILNVYSVQYAVSSLYTFVAVISIGLFIYCVLFIIFLSMSSLVLQQSVYASCIASGLIPVLLLYTILDYGKDLKNYICSSDNLLIILFQSINNKIEYNYQLHLIYVMFVSDLPFCLFYSFASVFSFSWLLRISLNQFQKTFTVGEAMLILQAVVIFITAAVAKVTSNLDDADKEMDFIYTIVYAWLSTVGIFITALCLLKDEQRSLEILGCIVGFCGVYGLLILHIVLGLNCIYNIFHYIFMEGNRALILLLWAVLVGISVVVLTARTQLAVKASTVTRKAFHVLASLVFMSGILLDPHLMILASGIGFGLLLFVEVCINKIYNIVYTFSRVERMIEDFIR
ncbi:unnamed protein product [Diatraea saccharalis]|uniref:dolichol kinase n=1 Tax=Diatraea saccharalis TaxID=40085 RepID=A0A9P0C5D1_9NEOP|nr:unnamed protein product [Diatraea saccharalis]